MIKNGRSLFIKRKGLTIYMLIYIIDKINRFIYLINRFIYLINCLIYLINELSDK